MTVDENLNLLALFFLSPLWVIVFLFFIFVFYIISWNKKLLLILILQYIFSPILYILIYDTSLIIKEIFIINFIFIFSFICFSLIINYLTYPLIIAKNLKLLFSKNILYFILFYAISLLIILLFYDYYNNLSFSRDSIYIRPKIFNALQVLLIRVVFPFYIFIYAYYSLNGLIYRILFILIFIITFANAIYSFERQNILFVMYMMLFYLLLKNKFNLKFILICLFGFSGFSILTLMNNINFQLDNSVNLLETITQMIAKVHHRILLDPVYMSEVVLYSFEYNNYQYFLGSLNGVFGFGEKIKYFDTDLTSYGILIGSYLNFSYFGVIFLAFILSLILKILIYDRPISIYEKIFNLYIFLQIILLNYGELIPTVVILGTILLIILVQFKVKFILKLRN